MSSSDYNLPRDQYLSFDGLSIREKIRARLAETGLFTDGAFEGSNISALNDVIAMSFSLLLFSLNKTANEGQLTEATIYDNVNRIVKLLGYAPKGSQSANLNFSLTTQNIPSGTYNIPRYSAITTGGIKYSLTEDFGFYKTTTNDLEIIDLSSDNSLLYQGSYNEFPTYIAEGIDNELIYLTTTDTQIIDNFHIDVYVKSLSGKWEKWNKTQSLYLSQGNDKVYEIRFNEKRRYEIKFGNNINGKKLNQNDSVAIYYLVSDGKKGEVGANVLDDKKMQLYSTVRFNQILDDISSF